MVYRVNSIDCGDEAADWLSQALQRPGSRLVQQNKTDARQSKLKDSIAGITFLQFRKNIIH